MITNFFIIIANIKKPHTIILHHLNYHNPQFLLHHHKTFCHSIPHHCYHHRYVQHSGTSFCRCVWNFDYFMIQYSPFYHSCLFLSHAILDLLRNLSYIQHLCKISVVLVAIERSKFTKYSVFCKWLPISNRINKCVLQITFKFVNDLGPDYLNEVFQWATESHRTLRNDYLKFNPPFRTTAAGQNLLSFLGTSKWNKLSEESPEKLSNINTFKHNFKKLYLAKLIIK